MENPFEALSNPSIIAELVKTEEGKKIAKRMLTLSKELKNLGDTERSKFSDEFGSKFPDVLRGFMKKPREDVIGVEVYLAVICVVIVFTFLGKSEKKQANHPNV